MSLSSIFDLSRNTLISSQLGFLIEKSRSENSQKIQSYSRRKKNGRENYEISSSTLISGLIITKIKFSIFPFLGIRTVTYY